jgi:hypothetical protein
VRLSSERIAYLARQSRRKMKDHAALSSVRYQAEAQPFDRTKARQGRDLSRFHAARPSIIDIDIIAFLARWLQR